MKILQINDNEFYVRRNSQLRGLTVKQTASGKLFTTDYGYPARKPPKDICLAIQRYQLKNRAL